MRSMIPVSAAILLAGCGEKSDPHAAPGHAGTKVEAPPHAGHGGPTGHADHRPAVTALGVRAIGEVRAGKPAELELTISGGAGQPLKDFATVHEAKVHLILIREGLDRFAHLHLDPDPATGVIKVRHAFPAGGTYHLFADHQPAGKLATTAVGRIEVAGDASVAPPLKPDAPGREATVRFELTDPAGPAVADLEPYMGATGHLVVVSEDASRYVHAHPTEGGSEGKGTVAFGATFPRAGLYKGWGQFRRGGQVRVVPFVVRVP